MVKKGKEELTHCVWVSTRTHGALWEVYHENRLNTLNEAVKFILEKTEYLEKEQ